MKLCLAHGRTFGKNIFSAKNAPSIAGWLVLIIAMLALARPAHAVVHASILVDAHTGKVLYEYHPDERAHPASLTKLMTLYLTFQRLADDRMTLGQRLHISRHAAAQQPSKMGLRAGSTVSVRSCILGIISHSANDAAVVLAENIAGSEGQFTKLMNEEARRLGMTRTVYYNASGLPNRRQWTTARDMVTLARAIIYTFPQYYHFFNVHTFHYHGRVLRSFDRMPEEYPGVDGMKTGFIDSSGFNIVTSAVRHHRRVVGVVLGGATAHARDLQMIALLNRGFASPSLPAPLLARAAAPRPARGRMVKADLARLDVDASGSGSADWVIQIGGGFHSSRQVRHILHSARLSAPRTLHHGHGLVVRLRGRRYQARFSDLSRAKAFEACSALREKRFTCRILNHSPETQQDLASAAGEKPAVAN